MPSPDKPSDRSGDDSTGPARRRTTAGVAVFRGPDRDPGPHRPVGAKDRSVEMSAKERSQRSSRASLHVLTYGDKLLCPITAFSVWHVKLTITTWTGTRCRSTSTSHAVRGPGGGAEASTGTPRQTKTFRFKAMYPGAYIYHCAVPNLDYHISAGMFGIILVEPKEGLPEVDREFYFGQHELYTDKEAGTKGHHGFDFEAMAREDPTYVLLNGEKYAITPDRHGSPSMQVGETARVYFVTGGPNLDSSSTPSGPSGTRSGSRALSPGRRTGTSRPRRSSRGPVPSPRSTPRCLAHQTGRPRALPGAEGNDGHHQPRRRWLPGRVEPEA